MSGSPPALIAAEVLEFERAAATAGLGIRRKARWVRMQFGLSLTRYHQILAGVVEDPAALATAPDVVARMRRLRDERRASRTARRLDASPPAPARRADRVIPFPASARPHAKEVHPMEQLQIDPIARAEQHLEEASAAIGEAKKERGMSLAAGAADPEWRAAVDEAIRTLATSRDDAGLLVRFTAEDVRRIAGDPPDHANAMGARFHWAARRGVIRKVAYRKSKRASLHAHPIAVWQGAGSQDEGEEVET